MNVFYKKQLFLGLLLSFFIVSTIFAFSVPTFAQNTVDTLGVAAVDADIALGSSDIRVTIVRIINIFLGLLGIIAVGIVLYGGFVWMTAGGNDEKVGTAKKILINGLIGLVIIMSSWAITSFVLKKLSEATGIVTTTDGLCSDVSYKLTHPGECGVFSSCADPDYKTAHPNLCSTDTCIDSSEDFVVKSITPVTDSTGMNNVVIRVLFNKPLGDGFTSDQSKINNIISNIKQDGVSILDTFDIHLVFSANLDGSTVYYGIDARPKTGILPIGDYVVSVNPNVTSNKGAKITEKNDCGEFPVSASFTVSYDEMDVPVDLLGSISYTSFDWNTDGTVLGGVFNSNDNEDHLVKGKRGNAYIFDNVVLDVEKNVSQGDTITFPNSPTFGRETFAVTSWVALHETEATYQAIASGGIASNGGWLLFAQKINGKYFLGVQLKTSKPGDWYLSKVPVSIDEFHHVVINVDSQAGMTFFVDGQAASITYNTAFTPVMADKFFIGSRGNAFAPLYFNGIVDEFTIFDVVLDKARIDNMFDDSNEFVLDDINPEISVDMGGMIEDGDDYIAYGGEFYLLNIASTDNSGIGYIDVSIEGTATSHYYAGPPVSRGSDAPANNPYTYTYRFDVPDPGDTTKEYDIKFYATDIDSNTAVVSKHIIARPEVCIENPSNPVCDTVDDYDTCQTDSDCSLAFKCLDTDETECTVDDTDCVCRAWPYIKQVDYMNGAAGNWITVQGYHFGEGDDGVSEVNFNFGDIQVPAVVTACSNDVWHDNWIVVEVPDEGDNIVAPSISVTNDDGFTDFTNDIDVGPDLGTFEYNDTVRPGLCSVTVVENDAMEYSLANGEIFGFGVGDTMAPPSIPVIAQGKSFGEYESGTSSLKFGNFAAAVSAQSWSNEAINATVPFMDAGSVATMVRSIGGLQSNSVPFTILGQEDLFPPVITSIDPLNTTPGSYVTIFGTNFGTGGTVSIGGLDSVALPEYCGNTWTDTQIIVKIPETIGVGDAVIRVNRSEPSVGVSTGDWSVLLEEGAPKPSLCKLSPSSGSVIEEITLRGENFSDTPKTFFWSHLAEPNSEAGWLTTLGGNNTDITTHIPTNDAGVTMITGPIKVKSSGGEFSNSMTYTIADCREPGSALSDDFKNNYQCCSEGPEAGHWKKGTAICEGGVREAGYMWRFTTGKIPQQFYVIESCDFDTGSPSPTPWESWKQGKVVCLNAEIETRFSLPINNESVGIDLVEQAGITKGPINDSNIRIFTCGSADTIDCAEGTVDDITDEFDVEVIGESKTSFVKKDASDLSPNTWYRVALYDGVLSQEVTTELGVEEIKNTKLLATQECDTGDLGKAAYCFEFKTGTGQCTLVSAGIHEKQYTTDLLGVVQDNRYKRVFDFALVWEPSFVKPLYYRVFGLGSQACTVLNVDDKPWNWGPVDTMLNNATAEHYSIAEDSPLSVGIATAQRQDLVGAEIFAELEEAGESIKAISTLKIDLGDPRIISKEPVCIEACVNTTISARFNQLMMDNNFVNGVRLSQCVDELCQTFVKTVTLSNISDPDDTVMRLGQDFLANGGYLEPSTWYLVEVNRDDINDSNKIKGIAGKEQELGADGKPVYISGNNAVATNWKFKTKKSAEACIVDTVEVKPDPFTAYVIGQTQDYVALPKGFPDACSAQGQYLSSWDYGWEWQSDDITVADITEFPAALKTNNSCTLSCLPKGSDVSKNMYTGSFPSCGNGDIDPGEDCDIAELNDDGTLKEDPGVSCQYNCLRPGNVNSTSTAQATDKDDINTYTNQGKCGDGIVSPELGEQCDFNNPELGEKGLSGFCNDICRWTGSQKNNTDPDNIYVPVCGSGDVTPGESCDIAINPKGCSESCLNTGTPLSQNWCDNSDNVNENSQPYCNIATSICGNGIIESDEECEVTGPNAISEYYCSDRCLLQNACDDDSVKQCNGGENPEEGCNTDCTYAGSSVLYSSPSLCGNGITETGEYPACELGATGAVSNYDGPIQIVTAVGTSPIDSSVTTSMYTTISSRAASTRNGEGTFDPITSFIDGKGDYTLMCGNKENIEVVNGDYNDCPANTGNTYGVGYNSCCQARPVRSTQYPKVNAGMEGNASAPVCRNTYLEVEFDNAEMSEQSFTASSSVRIVQGYTDADHECAEGQQDVTGDMTTLLTMLPGEDIGFWGTIWGNIKSFFVNLFKESVFAIDLFAVEENNPIPAGVTWCTSDIKVTTHVVYEYDAVDTDVVTGSRAQMYMDGALDPDVYVAVMLDGGAQGIHNVQGVGLKSPFGTQRSDVWVFKTGNAICKISSIDVEPDAALFKTPTASFDFSAQAISNVGNQQIIAIPDVYDWKWSWHPENNPLFEIFPTSTIILDDGTVNDASVTTIISRGVEGHIDGVLKADVTADIFVDENPQLGKTFTDTFGLTASFCANPWPHDDTVVGGSVNINVSDGVFADNIYNFDTYYCADAQNPLSKLDDLSLFDNVVSLKDIGAAAGGVPLSDDTLQRYFLFSSTTDDVIGVQIFENEPYDDGSRRTLDEWYIDKFENLGDMQPTSIDGYAALSNGMTYYINAYNVDKDQNHIKDIYNNIYQFTINENAGNSTQKVFEQFMNNLRFNINMSDHGYCLNQDIDVSGISSTYVIREVANDIQSGDIHNYVDVSCTTDFDCRDADAVPLPGTNGYCSNERTKFNRDLVRLQQVSTMQKNIANHISTQQNADNFVGDIDTSFVPGYTNSRWSTSWNRLATGVGGLATDPINDWRGCVDHDPLTCWNAQASTFKCPSFASVYEYQYDDSDDSFDIFTQTEYVKMDDAITSEFIDTASVQFARSCEGDIITVNPSTCGDGKVNYATEQCDPVGKEKATGVSCDFDGDGNNADGYYVKVCSDTCQWEADDQGEAINVCKESIFGQNVSVNSCGNNELDPGEFCDTVLEDDESLVCKYSPFAEAGDIGNDIEGMTESQAQDALASATGVVNDLTAVYNSAFDVVQTLQTDVKTAENIVKNTEDELNTAINAQSTVDELRQNIYFIFDRSKYIYRNEADIINPIKKIFDEYHTTTHFGARWWPQENSNGVCSTSQEILAMNFYDTNLNKMNTAIDQLISSKSDTFNLVRVFKEFSNDLSILSIPSDTDDAIRPKKIIVIASTANMSSSCNFDSDPNTDAVEETRNFISTLKDHDIFTYIIAYGDVSGADKSILESFASAGNTNLEVQNTVSGLYTAVENIINQESPLILAKKEAWENAKADLETKKALLADAQSELDIAEKAKDDAIILQTEAQALVDAFSNNEFFTCQTYKKDKIGSCSWDCTSYGGYCGDGYIQWANGEQCDDANKNNDDACRNNCINNVDVNPVCGNGFIEGEGNKKEQCDDGNTVSGDGCSSLCKLESDEPVCGDGEVNQEAEQCDLGNENGNICVPGYNESCTYCTGQCLIETFENPKRCGNGKIDYDNGKALEVCDYVLNQGTQVKVFTTSTSGGAGVLCSATDKGQYQCQSDCQYLKNECVACGYKENGTIPKLAVINPMVGKGQFPYSGDQLVSIYKNGMYQLPFGSRGIDKDFSLNQNINAYDIYPFVKTFNSSNDPTSIETNNQCNGEYQLFFNDGKFNESLQALVNANKLDYKQGDFFDYPVNGEQGTMSNEVVMVPAVPQGDLRIVLRWKNKSVGDPIKFVGGLYGNTPFTNGNYKTYMDFIDNTKSSGVCIYSDIYWNSNYWEPVHSSPDGCIDETISFHPIITTDKTGTQSITIMYDQNDNKNKIAFIVQSLNGPINQYKDYDIWVDVYEYHEGQSAKYSVYAPTKTYYFNQAQQSSNAVARYWYVFDIVKEPAKLKILPDSTSITIPPAYKRENLIEDPDGIVLTKQCQIQELLQIGSCPVQ